MEFTYQTSFNLKHFIEENNEKFKNSLLLEAVNVKDKIDEILRIGNINLVSNAQKLVMDIIDGNEEALQSFAKQEGIVWATYSIELSFKLEWIQAIRRTLWKFIQSFNLLSKSYELDNIFQLELQINNRVDQFLNAFFISYSKYKDSLIIAQRKLVENLSVPIIPITASVCILPLIGTVDSFRTHILEEKVLTEIGRLRIQTLIIDLSGIGDMEPDVIDHLMKIIDGTSMMGCHSIITGLRAEVVKKMIHLDNSAFYKKTQTLGTLQQALKPFFIQ
ncbi:STAS domain-containing protein [Robertmurraya korlensis]|jgi:rsbT co-antagonist protein RsbR|uniref:STAS domain-containing protein n=1 Tax=Robertmurraya korlensis TaxID=519977 RepID=UPI000827107D|nr:STAS domain-containing protein [Robertmurraya korlensis]